MMNEKLSRSLARFCSLCRSDSAQSMEGVWPQPALNLRARIEQLVASHTLHNTTYGKRLRAAAATQDALMHKKRRPAVPAFVWLQNECALKSETSSRSEACSRCIGEGGGMSATRPRRRTRTARGEESCSVKNEV